MSTSAVCECSCEVYEWQTHAVFQLQLSSVASILSTIRLLSTLFGPCLGSRYVRIYIVAVCTCSCSNLPQATYGCKSCVPNFYQVIHTSQNLLFLFNSQFLDSQQFYTSLDAQFMVDILRSEVAYIKNCWQGIGRPIMTITLTSTLLGKMCTSPAHCTL